MSNLNDVTLMGRLTRDPELKYTGTGKAVCQFALAINRPQGREARERGDKPQVDFLDCVAWGSQAENLANYQKKGSLILIKGRIQKRQYQNQEGENRYAVEVIANQVLFMPKNGNVPPPVEEDEAPF
ncbi:MAG: single-stranded DNA-binding protein [Syntrophomonadales bacterium]